MQKQKVLQQVLPEPKGEGTEVVARICRIGRMDYLITDCYTQGEHVVRIAQTKKEYSLYDVREKKWDNTLMRAAWERPQNWSVLKILEQAQADASTRQEVSRFTGRGGEAGETIWVELDKIRQEKKKKRVQRKEERRKADMESTPELPKGFKRFMERRFQGIPHMLLYKRNHNKATIWCGACGEESKIRTWSEEWGGIKYVPRVGEIAMCPHCREPGRYYNEGRKKEDVQNKYTYIIQKTKQEDVVIRMFKVQRIEEKGQKPVICQKEMMREYIGNAGVRKYYKWSDGTWDTLNPGGWNDPVKFKEGTIYPGYIDTIRDTECFRYCEVQQYRSAYRWKGVPEIEQIADVLTAYQKVPQIEFLWKKGMKKLTGDIVRGYSGQVNKRAKKPEDFLGIRKERLKTLGDIDRDYLDILQIERKMDLHMSHEQIDRMQNLCIGIDGRKRVENILKYMSLTKCLNRIEQYADEYNDRIRDALREYSDYLSIREELGYDMKNSVYLHPKHLRQVHAEMIKEREQRRAEGFINEKNKEFSRIAKRYKVWNKKYAYEKDGYLIRPARDAGEIVMEGRILHHCVGGDNYLRMHDSGKSIILFLRKKEQPDVPYITIEIQGTKVLQWYGIHDTKPEREQMQQYIEAYTETLKRRGEKKHERRSNNTGKLQPVQTAV